MSNKRQQFLHNGNVIYEWQESLDSVSVFIKPPPIAFEKFRKEWIGNNPGKQPPTLEVKIQNQSVSVGFKGLPPYLNHRTKGKVDTAESLWFLEGDILQIVLQKVFKGEAWMVPFEGHEGMSPLEKEEISKGLLMERFQEENPGFDFSQAQINGRVPDARTFMGGVRHQ